MRYEIIEMNMGVLFLYYQLFKKRPLINILFTRHVIMNSIFIS